MTDTVELWCIRADSKDAPAHVLDGLDSASDGGRWNARGVPMVYLSTSISLAVLETLVHLDESLPLPSDRWLIQVTLASSVLTAATRFDAAQLDAGGCKWTEGEEVSRRWGSAWAQCRASLLALVPSTIVFEEFNVLMNPTHPHSRQFTPTRVRRFLYDSRLKGSCGTD